MKIVGVSCVGGEASYLEKTLTCLNKLCDEVVIIANNFKQKEKLRDCQVIEDNREWGKFQNLIKKENLKKIAYLKPDFILWLDSDEVLLAEREDLEKLAQTNDAWYFYFINLWNSEIKHNPNLAFWNIRFWKYQDIKFENKPLHCGSAPRWAFEIGNYAPFLIKHYGLMKKSDRDAKVERYNWYDPKAQYKDRAYYNHLASEFEGEEFKEKEWIDKIKKEVASYKQPRKKINKRNFMEFVYVRRKADGKILDMKKQDWEDIKYTSRGSEFEFVSEIGGVEAVIPPIIEEPVSNLKCHCGFEAKSEFGLKVHQRKSHA